MQQIDFPHWYAIGSYGGFACGIMSAAGLALFALRRHRGTPIQLARAILLALAACASALVAIWWQQNRLDVYGPQLSTREVAAALIGCIIVGWLVPLATCTGYLLLATAPDSPAPPARPAPTSTPLMQRVLRDPARGVEPYGAGAAWAHLMIDTNDGAGAEVRQLAITRQLTLVGRELDNDIVLDDERSSRHHVRLDWDHGHARLVDLGSMNGTFVNQQPVRDAVVLRDGDLISIGMQRFRFQLAPLSDAVHDLLDAVPLQEATAKMAATHGDAQAAGSASTDVPHLVLICDAIESGCWELDKSVTLIGRDPACAICLPDPSVSRQHAQIIAQPAGYYVSDLRSSNGTLHNGNPLPEPVRLAPGDRLQIGTFTLRSETSVTSESAPGGTIFQSRTGDVPTIPQRYPVPHSDPQPALNPAVPHD